MANGEARGILAFHQEFSAVRWLAWFDLLGTQQLITDGREQAIIDSYSLAQTRIEARARTLSPLRPLWLSDTFLICASDDSGTSLAAIDSAARGFMMELLINRIPVRGAIACGRAYVDPDVAVAFGLGLLEAYHYADNQDWVGLTICPSAVARWRELIPSGFPRLNWVECAIPWSSPARRPSGSPDHLPAFVIGESGKVNGHNVCRDALVEMAAKVTGASVQMKYDRAVAHIDQFKRVAPDT